MLIKAAWLVLSLLVYPCIVIAPISATELTEKRSFSIADYFKIKRVLELSVSSDAEMVAYKVEFASLDENSFVQTVSISHTAIGAEPLVLDRIQSANTLTWIPRTHELAFIQRDNDNVAQIYSIDINSRAIRQYTKSPQSVLEFRFSPDGKTLAWLSRDDSDFIPSDFVQYERSTLYERLFEGDQGVVIDSDNTTATYFVNPERLDVTSRPPNELWVKGADDQQLLVEVPGQVKDFHWSPDSTKLSIVFAGDDLPSEHLSDRYTSVGQYDVAATSFQFIAHGYAPTNAESAIYYTGGEWIPNSEKLIIRRIIEDSRRKSKTEWTLVPSADDMSLESPHRSWSEIELYYGLTHWAYSPDILGVSEVQLLSNPVVRARWGLYEIGPAGAEQSNFFNAATGSVKLVRFDANFESAAFVNESLNDPPEIYIWRLGSGVRQLTTLNQEVAKLPLPKVREVTWKSKDGATVQGWLFEPMGRKSHKKPWPLVTFVHGGPSLPFIDEFAYYFKAGGGIWPYPFELYALNGMAVFVPNYRGTKTFGEGFSNPSAWDAEPIQDIVSGIEMLVKMGIANPEQLAISGQSYGAWLGSLAMTRSKLFRAASFAEGSQNSIVSYELNSGFINERVFDVQYGVSLYDDPARYIELSASLHFKGLDAAVLFEAGVKSNALRMLGSPKAAMRAGMPSELVVYPKTGHNIRLPQLMLESAARNLDWFRFWLIGEEDPDPEKDQRYVRWRTLRTERCMLNDLSSPPYCPAD